MWKLFRKVPRLGAIQISSTEEEFNPSEFKPSASGRLVGCITANSDGEALFISYEQKKAYYTFKEYAEWAGMICEAEVDGQFAYRLYVENSSTGKIYELPSIEVVQQFPRDKQCRCPFCMIEYAA